MIIDKATLILWVGTKALPALWAWWVAHTMTKAQIVKQYCPPPTELPANLTDFQKAQYEKQCGQVGAYIFEVKPLKKKKKRELIGPPEPVTPKAEETAPHAND